MRGRGSCGESSVAGGLLGNVSQVLHSNAHTKHAMDPQVIAQAARLIASCTPNFHNPLLVVDTLC